MTPEERCYKILQDSNYIRVPEENPAEKIESFLDSADGCPWKEPETETELRQFETSFKGWFKQFESELVDLSLNSERIIDGEKAPFTSIGLHTMDDYGFEGQILSDGSYWRIADDYNCENCKKGELCTDSTCKELHCSKCAEYKTESDF
jgi:hypothetical protein